MTGEHPERSRTLILERFYMDASRESIPYFLLAFIHILFYNALHSISPIHKTTGILMQKDTKNFQTMPFPKFRRLTCDAAAMAQKKHIIYGYIEVDVTRTRDILKAYRKKTGVTVSLTAFIIRCIGRAVDENKQMHAYLDGRNRLVVFDEVDLLLPMEMDIGEYKFPVIHVLRGVNRRSAVDIEGEIQRIRIEGRAGEPVRKSWRKIQIFLTLPGWLRRLFYRVALKNPHFQKRWLGTVAVTAVGMFGSGGGWGQGLSNHTLEIILGGISRRPVLVRGEPEDRDFLAMTISVDHDIIDGAPGARFVKRLRQLIESGGELNIP
jgi:pyruvate/2-oxoglutarate dehydrogenase complex dihydrolipoamide acyltransferase (E2) component